jgi:stress-induced-phosphoprotein 1
MIIYPAIILGLLLIGLFIVWRRAYLEQESGVVLASPVASHTSPAEKQQEYTKPIETKFEEAEVSITEAEEENFAKAEDLFKKKQYISAEKWYIEAVKKNPKNAKIFSRLGVIYLEQRNFADAIESLKEALRLDPDLATAYFNLSYALNLEGDKKGAIESARKALRIDADNIKYKKWFESLKNKPF